MSSQTDRTAFGGARLAIIMPVFNAERTLPRALASLSRISPFSRGAVEVIAVNDGSSDGSLAILRKAERDASPLPVRVIDQPNLGAAGARNAGLALARAEWVFLLDADDELAFDPLPLLRDADSVTCFGFALEYRRAGRLLSRVRPRRVGGKDWADALTAGNPYQPSSLVFRRSCIRRPFHTGIACVEDWLFWMSNPAIFDEMRLVPGTVSAVIHLHDRNISRQYALAGANRVRAAAIVECLYDGSLTRRQRNNLYLQQQIGRLQQGLRAPADTFLRFPCDVLLYLKLLVYAAASTAGFEATNYR